MKKLIYIFNHLRSGAVANIVRDIQPYISKYYDVHLVTLQPIVEDFCVKAELEALGITIHSLDCHRLNLIMAVIKLRMLLERLKPNVVHGHAGRSSLLVPLCSPKCALKFVTYHSVPIGHTWFTRYFLIKTNKLLTCAVGISKAVSAEWIALGAQNTITIYNPINPIKFSRRDSSLKHTRSQILSELKLSRNIPLVLNVGRLIYPKAQEILIMATHILVNKQVNLKVLIVGRGDKEDELKKLVRELRLEDYVIFTGFRNDIPALLAAADIFAFPSRWEGLGLAPMEAMSMEVPVVASNLPAIAEYIENNVSGVLVPIDNPEELADAIKNLLNDVPTRKRMAQAGRKKVQLIASPEKIANQYLSLYKKYSKLGFYD